MIKRTSDLVCRSSYSNTSFRLQIVQFIKTVVTMRLPYLLKYEFSMVRSSPVSRACHSPAPAHEKEALLSERLGGEKVIRLDSILSFLILLDSGIYSPAFCPL